VEDAKALALDDMKQMWGVSGVAGENWQNYMPYPPEKVLGDGQRIEGSFDWLTNQVRGQMANWVRDRGDVIGKLVPDGKVWPFHVLGTADQKRSVA
jgi:hypothetical protein